MKRRHIGFVIGVFTLSLGAICTSTTGNNNNGGFSLSPTDWQQIHSDGANNGFNSVHTGPAVTTGLKWSVPIGPTPFASPVSSPSGNIYIGSTNGVLVGLSPDGQIILSKAFVSEVIFSTVAVSSSGDIYVITSRLDEHDTQAASSLVQVNPKGDILHRVDIPVTMASPKVLGDRIYVATPLTVFVFDLDLNAVAQAQVDCSYAFCAGSNPFTDFLSCLTYDCWGPGAGIHTTLEPQPLLPSVAVTNASNLTDADKPLVVACSYPCLTCWQLNGNALELQWSFVLDRDLCDGDEHNPRFTSPTITTDGVVLLGYNNSNLAAFNIVNHDPINGDHIWSADVPPVIGTPTTGPRQIYVATNQGLYVIDGYQGGKGKIVASDPLGGHGALSSPALTVDNVYVAAPDGLYSFGINLEDEGHIDIPLNPHCDPMVDITGTLYVITQSGELQAYGGQNATPRVFQGRPHVSWLIPADGATISFAPGQPLVLNVGEDGGGGFTGHIAITSDHDPGLCDFDVTNATTASCTTTGGLTQGTRRLTAYATDPNGATTSATISVIVGNLPPTVTITSPTADASFAPNTTITFTAQVSDSEQSTFDAAKIQWQSSIDGNIGTGLTFTKKLSLGTHIITATATDDAGATGHASTTIHVSTLPTVTIISPTINAVVLEGTMIHFQALVSDPKQASFPADHIRWKSNVDGDIGTGLTFQKVLSRAAHTVTVTATDADGLVGTASVDLIVDAPPDVTIQQPTEGAILFSNSQITFSAVVTDPDEPSFPGEHILWTSNLDGGLGTGSTITHTLTNGSHTISVTATDAQGFSKQVSVHVTVQPPIQ